MNMSKAPDKIYIHEASAPELALPRKDYHLEYIRKDFLMEWAKDNFLNLRNRSIADGIKASAFEEIIDKLSSL